ncbi:hypothetical protein [Streptomyces sp. NPDC004296]|uniref:hypothetical protein n=1 Tax=Streptomyces sp. NPDC004296 TaxID=3364697 RepID=UPI0036C834F7
MRPLGALRTRGLLAYRVVLSLCRNPFPRHGLLQVLQEVRVDHHARRVVMRAGHGRVHADQAQIDVTAPPPRRASARKRGRTGGRPPSLDADQIEYALTLRAKGTPMKEIQLKTVITRGKHKGKHPSLPTLYRTLAEAAAQRTDT